MELRVQRLGGAKGGGFGFGVLLSWDSFRGVDILVGTHHIAVGRWSRSKRAEMARDEAADDVRRGVWRAEAAEARLAAAEAALDRIRAALGEHNQETIDDAVVMIVARLQAAEKGADRLRTELEAVSKERDEWKKTAMEEGDREELHRVERAAAESALHDARREIERKEQDRQYHMNAITRLAKRVDALGETSDAVVEKVLRMLPVGNDPGLPPTKPHNMMSSDLPNSGTKTVNSPAEASGKEDHR